MQNSGAGIFRRTGLSSWFLLTIMFLMTDIINAWTIGSKTSSAFSTGRTAASSSSSPWSNPHAAAAFRLSSATTLTGPLMSSQDDSGELSTFREAEVLGLKLMQERKYEAALKAFKKGLTLPGSKSDVIRTKSLSGPSPVGGSTGGYESQSKQTLDEFEWQAAHYNMACAHAQLGNLEESVAELEKAFQNGFDNYATVRADPDLDPVKESDSFEELMKSVEPKKGGFNPFGFFGGGGRS